MYHSLMGSASPSPSPPPDRRPATVDRHDSQRSGVVQNVDGCGIQRSGYGSGTPAMVADNNQIVHTGQGEPSTVTTSADTATVAKSNADNGTPADSNVDAALVLKKRDAIDGLVDDYLEGKKAMAKKPCAEEAATKAADKIAGIDREESQNEDSSEEDEHEGCDGESKKDRKRLLARIEKSKTKTKAKGKAKSKSTSTTKASTASAAKKAKAPAEPRPTMKRPAAVVKEGSPEFPLVDLKKSVVVKHSPSKFPRLSLTTSVYWGGGRIYKAKGDMIRVYPRTSDRHDKRFSVKGAGEAALQAAWIKGCNVINDDPRPRS
jgi:hypothetical protein